MENPEAHAQITQLLSQDISMQVKNAVTPGAHDRQERATAHTAKFKITLPTFNKLASNMFPYKELLKPRAQPSKIGT